ncbi:hypothetical protein LINGRAHAP2_LOCUS8081 [Linum grandiflorum]
MAGMLAGVECARRRRFHRSGIDNFSGKIRRPSFCLYPSNHEGSPSFATVASQVNHLKSEAYDEDEKLEDSAGEAKERLDERLDRIGFVKLGVDRIGFVNHKLEALHLRFGVGSLQMKLL